MQRLFDVRPGIGRRIARFGKHVQRGAVRLHDGAQFGVCTPIGNRQRRNGARLAGDEAFDEIIDRAQAGRVLQRDGIAQAVGQHGQSRF
jgi:hypothetical protein